MQEMADLWLRILANPICSLKMLILKSDAFLKNYLEEK
jgi:hypothetical protein